MQQNAKTVNIDLGIVLYILQFMVYFHVMIFGITNNKKIEVSAKLYTESQLLIIYLFQYSLTVIMMEKMLICFILRIYEYVM